MISKRKYKRPAVLEAIFEAKFSHAGTDFALPGQVFEKIKKDYPEKRDIHHLQLTIGKIGSPVGQNDFVPAMPVMQAWKKDQTELLQVGYGIVSANRLKYTRWDDFLPSIEKIFDAYVESAEPEYMTRFGIRYINSFILPEEKVNISDYFNLGLKPPPIMTNIKAFDFTFLYEPKYEENHPNQYEVKTKFTTGSLKDEEKGNKLVLDMECYAEINKKPKKYEVLEWATQAHDILSNVFEGFITDKTRDFMGVEK